MIVTEISELFVHPVLDRGVPNSERVAIYAQETIDIGRYGVMVGHAGVNNTAVPFQDNLFWFGDGVVNKGDWIILYTGKGESRVNEGTPPNTKVFSTHWGRGATMFANTNIVPILFRMDSVYVGRSPIDLPQLGNLNTK